MDRMYGRVVGMGQADRIALLLENRQYLQPHQELGEALADLSRDVGFCEGAAASAMAWLQLAEHTKIGRLRRSEIMQLASAIDRLWGQVGLRSGEAPTAPAPQR